MTLASSRAHGTSKASNRGGPLGIQQGDNGQDDRQDAANDHSNICPVKKVRFSFADLVPFPGQCCVVFGHVVAHPNARLEPGAYSSLTSSAKLGRRGDEIDEGLAHDSPQIPDSPAAFLESCRAIEARALSER